MYNLSFDVSDCQYNRLKSKQKIRKKERYKRKKNFKKMIKFLKKTFIKVYETNKIRYNKK